MDASFWRIMVLAVIQGITEFLPISSDGHLLVAAAVLSPTGSVQGMDVSDVIIVLHIGTLASIIVFYWRRVWRLLGEDRRTAWMLILGTLPAVIIGLPLKKFGEESILEAPLLAGIMLPVTGLILVWAARRPRGTKEYQELTVRETLWIGLCQATALLPGLSRSGTTISSGLGLGLKPQAAATFSFLLAIPAVGGAVTLEILEILGGATIQTPASYLIVGALVSFIVGLAALWVLVRMLERGKLQWFALWCVPLGIAVIIWQLSLPTPAPVAP